MGLLHLRDLGQQLAVLASPSQSSRADEDEGQHAQPQRLGVDPGLVARITPSASSLRMRSSTAEGAMSICRAISALEVSGVLLKDASGSGGRLSSIIRSISPCTAMILRREKRSCQEKLLRSRTSAERRTIVSGRGRHLRLEIGDPALRLGREGIPGQAPAVAKQGGVGDHGGVVARLGEGTSRSSTPRPPPRRAARGAAGGWRPRLPRPPAAPSGCLRCRRSSRSRTCPTAAARKPARRSSTCWGGWPACRLPRSRAEVALQALDLQQRLALEPRVGEVEARLRASRTWQPVGGRVAPLGELVHLRTLRDRGGRGACPPCRRPRPWRRRGSRRGWRPRRPPLRRASCGRPRAPGRRSGPGGGSGRPRRGGAQEGGVEVPFQVVDRVEGPVQGEGDGLADATDPRAARPRARDRAWPRPRPRPPWRSRPAREASRAHQRASSTGARARRSPGTTPP